MIPSYNKLALECHEANQHWWKNPATGEWIERNVGELFILMISEVCEAMEGERKSLMDNHLPHRPSPEVELADAVIRIMDYAGRHLLDLDSSRSLLIKTGFPHNMSVSDNRGECLMDIVEDLSTARGMYVKTFYLAKALYRIELYAARFGYDLEGAIAEKRAFNLTRIDHTNEARLAEGGKKW